MRNIDKLLDFCAERCECMNSGECNWCEAYGIARLIEMELQGPIEAISEGIGLWKLEINKLDKVNWESYWEANMTLLQNIT